MSAVSVVKRQKVRTEQRRTAAQSYLSVAVEELKNVCRWWMSFPECNDSAPFFFFKLAAPLQEGEELILSLQLMARGATARHTWSRFHRSGLVSGGLSKLDYCLALFASIHQTLGGVAGLLSHRTCLVQFSVWVQERVIWLVCSSAVPVNILW